MSSSHKRSRDDDGEDGEIARLVPVTPPTETDTESESEHKEVVISLRDRWRARHKRVYEEVLCQAVRLLLGLVETLSDCDRSAMGFDDIIETGCYIPIHNEAAFKPFSWETLHHACAEIKRTHDIDISVLKSYRSGDEHQRMLFIKA